MSKIIAIVISLVVTAVGGLGCSTTDKPQDTKPQVIEEQQEETKPTKTLYEVASHSKNLMTNCINGIKDDINIYNSGDKKLALARIKDTYNRLPDICIKDLEGLSEKDEDTVRELNDEGIDLAIATNLIMEGMMTDKESQINEGKQLLEQVETKFAETSKKIDI